MKDEQNTLAGWDKVIRKDKAPPDDKDWPPNRVWLPDGVVMLAAVSPELENVEGAFWVREEHSTSDVLGNPDRGMSVRNQPESESKSGDDRSSVPLPSDVQKKIAEIRERVIKRGSPTVASLRDSRDTDIDSLLSAITVDNELIKNGDDYIAEGDDAMRALLISAGLTWNHLGFKTSCERLAERITELSTVDTGYVRGLSDAQALAQSWADSPTCSEPHEDNPCCHKRTGAGIADAVGRLISQQEVKEP